MLYNWKIKVSFGSHIQASVPVPLCKTLLQYLCLDDQLVNIKLHCQFHFLNFILNGQTDTWHICLLYKYFIRSMESINF